MVPRIPRDHRRCRCIRETRLPLGKFRIALLDRLSKRRARSSGDERIVAVERIGLRRPEWLVVHFVGKNLGRVLGCIHPERKVAEIRLKQPRRIYAKFMKAAPQRRNKRVRKREILQRLSPFLLVNRQDDLGTPLRRFRQRPGHDLQTVLPGFATVPHRIHGQPDQSHLEKSPLIHLRFRIRIVANSHRIRLPAESIPHDRPPFRSMLFLRAAIIAAR